MFLFRDFLLIFLGIVISSLQPFSTEFLRAIMQRNWRIAMQGLTSSWKGLLRVLAVVLLITSILGVFDWINNNKENSAEMQRHNELLEAIKKQNENIERILNELEARNAE